MSKNFAMENKNLREPLRGRVPRGCEKKDSDGNKICRVCNEIITVTGRRTFCSPACVHEHKLRSNIDYMRKFVFERDKGICAICKIDCVSLLEKTNELSLNDYTRLLLPLGFIRGRIIRAHEKKLRSGMPITFSQLNMAEVVVDLVECVLYASLVIKKFHARKFLFATTAHL